VHIDDPHALAELRIAFDRYEVALLANDLATLDDLFWNDQRVVRFGFDDCQHGYGEVSAFRASLVRQSPPRRLSRVTMTTFGPDVAVVAAEFAPEGSTAVGRQSQTWARVEGQWKVVHGHVSWQGAGAQNPPVQSG